MVSLKSLQEMVPAPCLSEMTPGRMTKMVLASSDADRIVRRSIAAFRLSRQRKIRYQLRASLHEMVHGTSLFVVSAEEPFDCVDDGSAWNQLKIARELSEFTSEARVADEVLAFALEEVLFKWIGLEWPEDEHEYWRAKFVAFAELEDEDQCDCDDARVRDPLVYAEEVIKVQESERAKLISGWLLGKIEALVPSKPPNEKELRRFWCEYAPMLIPILSVSEVWQYDTFQADQKRARKHFGLEV